MCTLKLTSWLVYLHCGLQMLLSKAQSCKRKHVLTSPEIPLKWWAQGGPRAPEHWDWVKMLLLLICLWSLLPLHPHHSCLLLGPRGRMPGGHTDLKGLFYLPETKTMSPSSAGDPRPCIPGSPVPSYSANCKDSPPWAQLSYHLHSAPFLLVPQHVNPSEGLCTSHRTGIFFFSKI